MFQKFFIIFIVLISLISCSKKEVEYEPKNKSDPYALYAEAYDALDRGDYFFAQKKFSEAELNFEKVEFAAKSAVMASYAYYGINFYTEALENLERYLKKYPADDNIVYAHYLIALIYFEQIADELLNFIKDKKIIIHNASFDLGFLDGELASIPKERIITICNVADDMKAPFNVHSSTLSPTGPNVLNVISFL